MVWWSKDQAFLNVMIKKWNSQISLYQVVIVINSHSLLCLYSRHKVMSLYYNSIGIERLFLQHDPKLPYVGINCACFLGCSGIKWGSAPMLALRCSVNSISYHCCLYLLFLQKITFGLTLALFLLEDYALCPYFLFLVRKSG